MSIKFGTIIDQQKPYLNNYAQNKILITTVIILLAILDAGMDSRS